MARDESIRATSRESCGPSWFIRGRTADVQLLKKSKVAVLPVSFFHQTSFPAPFGVGASHCARTAGLGRGGVSYVISLEARHETRGGSPYGCAFFM